MSGDLIAALDVGKTHTRLTLLHAHSGAPVSTTRRANLSVLSALGRQLDVYGIEQWLVDTLKDSPFKKRLTAIVPIAHGAAAVLIDDQGRILAAPDYENPSFEKVNEPYENLRDPFDHTYSPSMPLGLNLGRQLFCFQQYQPELFARTAHILLYPQYWAWRLSGVMASEVTSLGCHSDLWVPHTRSFSTLAVQQGWPTLFPALKFAGDRLGGAQGPIGQAAGLPRDCQVVCGIHDSNASYLRYLLSRRDTPFVAISSGTWTVVLANQAPLDRLRVDRSMSANVDAFGSAVPTARFMGGREYEAIAATTEPPTLEAAKTLLDRAAMALPAFAPGGPFGASQGRLLHAEGLTDAERAALATMYVALMSDLVLESLGATGDVIVDGPLAANALFAGALAQWRLQSKVLVDAAGGAAEAVCFLAGMPLAREPLLKVAQPLAFETLTHYRRDWRRSLPP